MNRATIGFLVLANLMLSGCRKDDVPQEAYYFTFKVNISNKITEPTIVNGYHGTLIDKNGKVKLKKDSIEANITPVADNRIYLFEVDKKAAIEEAATTGKNGVTVYDLKKLKKADIKAKFIIKPNKSGFFQFDTGDKPYIPLIEVKGKVAYYPGGLTSLPALTGELINLDLAVDY